MPGAVLPLRAHAYVRTRAVVVVVYIFTLLYFVALMLRKSEVIGISSEEIGVYAEEIRRYRVFLRRKSEEMGVYAEEIGGYFLWVEWKKWGG